MLRPPEQEVASLSGRHEAALMILRAVLLPVALGVIIVGCGDAADEPTLEMLQTQTAPDEPPECKICAPDLEMRVGSAVLRGTPGTMTYSGDSGSIHGDAFAIITPAASVDAPIGVDGLITLPAGFVGTPTSVVVYEVGGPTDRSNKADCLNVASPSDEFARWGTCSGAINVVTSHEFRRLPSASEFSVPLAELVSEPGLYVISMLAEISRGPETWDENFGFFVQAV